MAKLWSERRTAISSNFKDDSLFTLMEKTNSNLFITGAAGTGKSTVLKNFVELTKKNCVVLAPTGIAATNVEGQTIHSFFGLPPGIPTQEDIGKKRYNKLLYETVETIIIDEISMVRRDLFEAMDGIMRQYKNKDKPFGGAQLILFGDMYQLPPIVSSNERPILMQKYLGDSYYFFDSEIYSELNLWIISLNYIYRQTDSKFIDILNRMQKGKIKSDDLDELNSHVRMHSLGDDHIRLYTTNRNVDEENRACLNRINLPEKKYVAEIDASLKVNPFFKMDKYCNAAENLVLKVGARVMILINDSSESKRYFNGSLGTIFNLDNDSADIKLDATGETIILGRASWKIYSYKYEMDKIEKKENGQISQIPLKLAWAITIHKSQGQTIDKANICFGNGTWEHGQAYVAFSRLRSLKGLALQSPINKQDFILDSRITSWEAMIKSGKISFSQDTQDLSVSNVSYAECKDVVEKITRCLLDDFEIFNTGLVGLNNDCSIKISRDTFFFNFIRARIIFLLEEIKNKTGKDIILDNDKVGSIKLNYKPSPKSWVENLKKKLDAQKKLSN